jgi:hypothetical protein
MNKIVREHYPVSSLPDDLREGLRPDSKVRVVIEEIAPVSEHSQTLRELIANARHLMPIGDDSVERIRKLRNEWDD